MAGRVLLSVLSVRTSREKGTLYMSGFLGKARLVAFQGEADQWGNPTWELYAATPDRDQQPANSGPPMPRRPAASSARAPVAEADELDDEIPF